MSNVIQFPQLKTGIRGSIWTNGGVFTGTVDEIGDTHITLRNVSMLSMANVNYRVSLPEITIFRNQICAVTSAVLGVEVI